MGKDLVEARFYTSPHRLWLEHFLGLSHLFVAFLDLPFLFLLVFIFPVCRELFPDRCCSFLLLTSTCDLLKSAVRLIKITALLITSPIYGTILPRARLSLIPSVSSPINQNLPIELSFSAPARSLWKSSIFYFSLVAFASMIQIRCSVLQSPAHLRFPSQL